MLKRFFPSCCMDSVYDIPYESLKASGITALIFDIDNTLVPHDIPHPTAEVTALFTRLLGMGFKICLLSNNSAARVAGFNDTLQFPNIAKARKPSRRGIRRAMALLEAVPAETVLIGDQIFTDVWGGNRAGIKVILIKPVSARDEITVRLKRGVEKMLVNEYLRRQKAEAGKGKR